MNHLFNVKQQDTKMFSQKYEKKPNIVLKLIKYTT